MEEMDQVMYVVEEADNVATALLNIQPGTVKLHGARTGTFEVAESIPFGHKAALKDIAAGEEIIKYAYKVAIASQPIKAGRYVHLHNAKSAYDNRSNSYDFESVAPPEREYRLY